MILAVKSIDTFYGQSHILQDVSLEVGRGEVVSLLGRNGVGKTTTLRSIMGLTPPRSGSIFFTGRDIARRQAYEIARLGIGYVPDDRRIFPDLTVLENLEIAARVAGRQTGEWTLDRVYALFPILEEYRNRKGTQLSGGEQKMLAIGRALMKNPELILLDEPAEGLAPMVVRNLVEVIQQIRQAGVTILIADQNLKFCRRVADRAYILEKGRVQYGGRMEEIWANETIVKQYLAV